MNELHTILDKWREVGAGQTSGCGQGGKSAVLATVVHVSGSAYRRPGARMLILPNGQRIGSVSGGCLEGELARRAWWLTESGEPTLRVYDTASDDDAVWEFGLGCNGVVQVMLERVDSPVLSEALAFLDAHRDAPVVVATLVRSERRRVGSRVFFDGRTFSGGSLEGAVREEMWTAYRERTSRFVHLADAEVFVEWIGPSQELVIFGAGHDARPLVTIAKQLGWHVTLADGRPAYACAENFPDADRVVLFPAADPLRGVQMGAETAVVLMTHNYPLDARLLPLVLAREPRYVGLLGPKDRADRLFRDLGVGQPESVHAPAGLDIGSGTPAAVALSIVSEIQAVLSKREGAKLRLRNGAIHAPVVEIGAARPRTDQAHEAYCEIGAA